MTNQFRDYGELRVTMTSDYEWMWDDGGSGASRDVKFWKPKPQGNLRPVGCVGIGAYHGIVGKRATLLIGRNPNVNPPSGKGPAVVEPTDYNEIWRDQKSGAKYNGSIWRPVSPPGYVSLSDVVVGSWNKPSKDMVWCVRTDLIVQGVYASNSFWDDKKSGASRDVSCWHIIPETNGRTGNEKIAVCPDGFRASPNYDKPVAQFARMFALKLPRDFKDFTSPLPRLDPNRLPSKGSLFNEMVQASVTLPFVAHFSPTDERCLNNITKPFCTFSRSIAWFTQGVWSNGARGSYDNTDEITFGISKTQSTEITHTAGIDVSANFGIGFVNFDVSLNYQFSHSSSSSFTEYSERKVTEKFDVPPYHATVLFTKHIWLKAARMDGSIVMVSVEIAASDERYFVGVDLPHSFEAPEALGEAETEEKSETEEKPKAPEE